MLKAEDLEHQQREQNLAATIDATTVGNVATNQDRGGPHSPPSYSTPAPSRFYSFQNFHKKPVVEISLILIPWIT